MGKVVRPFSKGGLNIGSLKLMNYALLAKWWWRLLKEEDALWVRVIHSLYGRLGGLWDRDRREVRRGTTWGKILEVGRELDEEGINFSNSFRKKVGNGRKTRFWEDRWLGSRAFVEEFPRLYQLEVDVEAIIFDRGEWVNEEWVWRWRWRREPRGREMREIEELERRLQGWNPVRERADNWVWGGAHNGEFSVKNLREMVDEGGGVEVGEPEETTWCPIVPRKVNIFIWRLKQGRIPTRSVLSDMGLDNDSILCPRCGEMTEDRDHALLKCAKVRRMWDRVGTWCNIDLSGISSIEQMLQEDAEKLKGSHGNEKWIRIKWCFLYLLWRQRNNLVFKGDRRGIREMFFEWQKSAFEWISNRVKNCTLDWFNWLSSSHG